ncbi:DUF4391 domain-containing protein [Salinibacterium sp. UTAS2018]|uniref:DUF4391 domain-containing protein n=1 Tax=Salinibacterium sp. UTAS2018 TaxID=2508880 RepID=UPI00100941D1|nr:DUF4391 domain-containing protein [Salinibacterium sp. UTAS2018]QAV69226.1 DUF4391 domain-containing protein [Salinibacterium sp. UTAS2018]
MVDLLYSWPAAAKFGSRVPKEKFYAHGSVSTAVREKFVSEVQRITWAYKLAESTINLPGSAAVPEIQIFHIDTKTGDVADQVLSAIDKAIQFPIIFEVTRTTAGEPQVRMAAAHKLLSPGAPKLSTYYSTSWLSADAERQSLPTAIRLPTLYAAILEPLMPVTVRQGEEMSEVADRLATVRKLEREITALERKLHTEPQLNRKIELRRTLKTRQQELEQQR